jgi:hypothetical protein
MNGSPERSERSEVGRDVLDVEVSPVLPTTRLSDVLTRTRAALGLRPIAAPALLFVPLGAGLGPLGVGVLTIEALGHLYPVLAMALAALGVFVGLGFRVDRREERRLLMLASVEALTTVVVVSAACLLLLTRWQLPLGGPATLMALVLGICASATAAAVARPDDPRVYHTATRMADLDDVLPIVAGGIVLAIATADGASPLTHLTRGVGIPLALAAAGWLLFERADDERERGVFLLGAIALLGGSAVYLNASPLLAGLIAGSVWVHAPGRSDTIVRTELQRLQHPLIVLLLLCAGALAPLAPLGLIVSIIYVLTRLCGKLLGGSIVSHTLHDMSAVDLGSHLLSPGVLGLAFALSVHLAVGTAWSGAALTAVAVGTLVSELIAAFVMVGPRR